MFNILYFVVAILIIIIGIAFVEKQSTTKNFTQDEISYIAAIIFFAIFWPIVIFVLLPLMLIFILIASIGIFLGKLLKNKENND